MSTLHTPRSSAFRRAAAVLGLAVVSGLGTVAVAAPAGAAGDCPWYNPYCNGLPTNPTLPPITRPPAADPPDVADPPVVADPDAGDPPASPPQGTPGTPPQGTPTGGQQGGGQAPQGNPAVTTPDDAAAATETALEDDADNDDGGSSTLPIIAGVGALAAASGAGFYLYRTRRA